MTKIYIATSREFMGEAKAFAEVLTGLGHTITHPWWEDVERLGTVDNQAADGEELFACAIADVAGVEAADLFWLLAPATGGTGCWVELGMAIACRDLGDDTDEVPPDGRHVIVSGACDRTLFTILNEVDECFDTHDSAFAFITREFAS